DPVVRQAVPGGELEHGDVRREEGERARKRCRTASVAAHDQKARRRSIRAGSDRTCKICRHEAFCPVGHPGQGDRLTCPQEFGRRPCKTRSPRRAKWKSRKRRNRPVSCAAGTSHSPVIQASTSRSGSSINRSNSASSFSSKPSIVLSAKRPIIRS